MIQSGEFLLDLEKDTWYSLPVSDEALEEMYADSKNTRVTPAFLFGIDTSESLFRVPLKGAMDMWLANELPYLNGRNVMPGEIYNRGDLPTKAKDRARFNAISNAINNYKDGGVAIETSGSRHLVTHAFPSIRHLGLFYAGPQNQDDPQVSEGEIREILQSPTSAMMLDRSQADCAGATEPFFSEEATQIAMAATICGGCPIREDCLSYGLDTNSSGLWGGVALEQGVFTSNSRPSVA